MPTSVSVEPKSVTIAVGDELVERLHVVGHPRDQHARLAARVEADRERLQVREELDAQVLQRPAGRPSPRGRSARRTRPSRRAPRRRRRRRPGQRAGVARHDAVVDRELGQRRRRERRGGRRDQRDEHEDRARRGRAAAARAGRAACARGPPVCAPAARRGRRAARSQLGHALARVAVEEHLVGQALLGDLRVERGRLEQLVVRAARGDPRRPRARRSRPRARSWRAGGRSRTSCGPAITSRSAALIACSVEASTEDVASSRTRIRGSLSSARAIAMRWRWPPESVSPRSPTRVS